MGTKITIIGDIMCEPLLLRAAKRGDSYSFDKTFEKVKGLLKESDLVIGNMETPFAGERAGYTRSLFSFNAPDSFLDAATNAGIDFFLTANNHCLDRGVDGLIRTVRILKERKIPFSGTNDPDDERKEATYIDVNGVRVAVISYTYGTNFSANHIRLEKEQQKLVNLLRPQDELYYVPRKPKSVPFYKRAVHKALMMIPSERRLYIKSFLGLKVNTALADDNLNRATAEKYLSQLRKDLLKAREKADLVIFCPHVGGQFNIIPGAFSEYIVQQAAACSCDAIIASHAHIVQKAKIIDGAPCFYSIGNFCMSPNSIYLLHENLPDYGLAVHLYVDHGHILKTTFSILKIVETKKKALTVYPVDVYKTTDLKSKEKLIHDVKQIYHAVTGSVLSDNKVIQKEYELLPGE